MGIIENFEAMLAAGQDSALLRYTLGGAYLKEKRYAPAIEHLRKAVELDPEYSAAWKSLGKVLAEAGERAEAVSAYRQGVEVAERRGDKQAAKEMAVFLKRLTKAAAGD
jgi:Flp pilus assembly protein TadD